MLRTAEVLRGHGERALFGSVHRAESCLQRCSLIGERRSAMTATRYRVVLGTLVFALVTFSASLPAEGIIERSHHVSNSFNVLAYNVFMRPEHAFSNDQAERAAVLPVQLRGFDVIVFSEAFDNSIRSQLLAGLAADYPYRTKVLGTDWGI